MGFNVVGRAVVAGIAVAATLASSALADPKTPQDWPALTQKLQEYLDANLADFKAMKESLASLPPHQLKVGRGGLMMQRSERDEWTLAPDDVSEQITPHFKKLNLMRLRYAPNYVQFMPRAPAHGYKGRNILFFVVYAVESEGVPKCTEASLMAFDKEFGRCWLSMRPDGWYIDFAWGRSHS